MAKAFKVGDIVTLTFADVNGCNHTVETVTVETLEMLPPPADSLFPADLTFLFVNGREVLASDAVLNSFRA